MGEWGRPTAMRRALGQSLRRLRQEAGLTLSQAAERSKFSQPKITKIELAQMTASAEDVDRLLAVYGGVTQETREELHAMVRGGRRREWWEGHTALRLPPKLGNYLGLESVATTLRAYDPSLVHGLLQTADYARAVIRGGRPELLDYHVEQLIEARARRQEVLTREDPPPLMLWSVMDEAVLRRQVGGQETMHAQIQHLIAMSAMPNVTLQVMPDSLGAHAGMAGRLTILQFEASARPVVYVDGQAGNLYMERDEDLQRCQQAMNHILAMAPGPEQSLALLRQAAKAMKP